MSDGAPDNRRGRLLVAAPALVDPNFRRSVVLMLEHSDEGALGLVLNRPTPLVSREALPEALAAVMPEQERIFQGGPVQPEAVIVLADFEDTGEVLENHMPVFWILLLIGIVLVLGGAAFNINRELRRKRSLG